MDKLFDSVNGSSLHAVQGKNLRCAVQQASPHIQFWYEAIKVLQTMKFMAGNGREFVPPTVKNWIATIKRLIYLWRNLEKQGFQFLCTRTLNQDPLENFFGSIRSHGIRNVNPTCYQFISSFKSLLISNFMSAHAPNANCEADDSEGALENLRHFLFSSDMDLEVQDLDSENSEYETFIFSDISESVITLHAYIAGYLTRSLRKTVGNCQTCRKFMLTNESLPEHQYIEAREYSIKSLKRPQTRFTKIFGNCCKIAHFYIPSLCAKRNIIKILETIINRHVDIKSSCEEHNLQSMYVKTFLLFYIRVWTKNVNKILKGQETRSSYINDNVKELARKYNLKFKPQKRS